MSEVLNDDKTRAFLKEHEFFFRFHLSQLERATNDISVAYKNLRALSECQSREDVDPNAAWDNLELLSRSMHEIIQTLKPYLSRRRSKAAREFTKARGLVLSALLKLDASDSGDLKEIRNRITHSDEDFDDWYVHEVDPSDDVPLKLRRKTLFFDKVHLHSGNDGVLMGYDITAGVFHTLGKQQNIHQLYRVAQYISDQLPGAHSALTDIAQKKTTVTML